MSPVRSLSALALGALIVIGLAACSSGTAPGWTYVPPPSVTAAPSSAAGSPAAVASAAPASAAASTGPAAGTTVLPLVAKGVQFTTTTLEAPAGQPFQIAFDNQDASIQHNVQIVDAGGTKVFDGDVVTGVAQATYNIGALPAGAYKFSCRIHPNMAGDLVVK